ncbi:hypothetical protein B0A48_03667 [Cryoendolithus antarcticus]|uniref:GPI-anchored wall transfer protein n=1 Tax=Cryoendolithus antarcticus TaxID=1507870 RepID=A0A1V8TKN8_9PEZI|nr:hypothetical protein B0A48_03667 [Cryoendolithus antarcticus]
MTPEYKAEKLASVSDLQGGGIWEINLLTLAAPISVFVWSVLQTRQAFFKPYNLTAYITDFILQCCMILFATTIYADQPQTLLGLLLVPAIAVYLQPKAADASEPSAESSDTKVAVSNGTADATASRDEELVDDRSPLPVKPFITSYRGAMMIITCASILAVDFPVFPRRFAKTENFGTSLMDLGVGSFVFAAGIVAARQHLKDQLMASHVSFFNGLKTSLRHALPLFALGLVRLASVKSLDYTEHISEYGVHWNFFFTLALLSPTTALLQPILRRIPSIGTLAFCIAIGYEIYLYLTPGMKAYILLSDRIPGDFLSQNREGIYSFIGYFAIFLGGFGVGEGILPRDQEPSTETTLQQAKRQMQEQKDSMDEDAEWLASVLGQSPDQIAAKKPWAPDEALRGLGTLPKLAVIHLAKWSALWFIFSTWAMWHYGPRLFVSRRMANLAYVCWVCAFNTAQLLLFCGVEMLMFPQLYRSRDKVVEKTRIEEATSKVLAAFNRNGLVVFLLANLLTGAVNLSVKTWHVGDIEAMVWLVGYVGVVCGTSIMLDQYGVSIKL